MQGGENKKMQEKLREQVKIAKALYGKDFNFTYKDIAEMLNMNINSFYNWLSGYYDLGKTKENELKAFLNDLLY